MKLELNDWLFNAGIVGFYNILYENNDLKPEKNNEMYFEFDKGLLEGFEYKYFNYFIKKYIMYTPYGKIIVSIDKLEKWSKDLEIFSEKDIKELNDITKFTKDKLARASYKSAYQIIDDNSFDVLDTIKQLYSLKLTKSQSISDILSDIKNQINVMMLIISYITKDNVKSILLSKEFTYTFTNEFLSNVAIWNKNNSSRNAYNVYKEFFLDSLDKYFKSDEKKFKISCINCNRKLSSEFETGLTWIKAMGVDSAKKPAHYWNFNPDVSICPVCTLVYSCIPAGFQYLNGKGFFINNNSSFETLRKLNTPVNYMVDAKEGFTIEELEYESYFVVADAMKNMGDEKLNEEIDNIQIVKYDSGNGRRPYTFNVLNKEIAYIIYKSSKWLKLIIKKRIKISSDEYMNPYEEVIGRLFKNKSLFDLIHKLIYLDLDNKNCIYIADVVMSIQKNVTNIKEGNYMYRLIDSSRRLGLELKKSYTIKDKSKKIDTITYKLLNALKTKNANKFVDIIINTYVTIGIDIPEIFTQTLMDEKKLLNLGYAFVLGLKGKEENKTQEEVK